MSMQEKESIVKTTVVDKIKGFFSKSASPDKKGRSKRFLKGQATMQDVPQINFLLKNTEDKPENNLSARVDQEGALASDD